MAYNLGVARGIIQLLYNSAAARRAEGDLSDVERRARRTQRGMALLGAAAAAMGTVVVAGLAFALNASIDFEKQISAVGAVSGATGDELEKLRDKALQLGADTSFSASEAALAMEELAKNGLTVTDMLDGAADAAVNLAAAGGVELARAAEIASTAMTIFAIKAEDVNKVVDLLAQAANASAADVEDLAESMKYAGPVAKALGLKIEDVITAFALFAAQGIKGSSAGTALRGVLVALQPQSIKATKLMKELGLITKDGANLFFDASGKMKGLADVAEILQDKLGKLSPKARSAALELIFGREALAAVTVLTEKGAEGFEDMGEAMDRSGTAADVAKKRLDNTAGSIEALKGSIETLAIRVGDKLRPALRGAIDAFTKVVNGVTDIVTGVEKLDTKALEDFLGDAKAAKELIAEGLRQSLDDLKRAWKDNKKGVEDFGEALGKLLGPLDDARASAGQAAGFLGYIATVWDNVVFTIGAATATLVGIFGGLGTALEGIVDWWTSLFRIIAAIFTSNTEALGNAWRDFWNATLQFLEGLWMILRAILVDGTKALLGSILILFGGFGISARNIWNSFVAWLKDLWEGFKVWWSGIWKDINNLTAGILVAIYQGIVNFGRAVGRFISDLWKKLTQSTKNELSSAGAAVSGAMSSIRTSIANAFNSVRSSVINAMSSARNAVSNGVSSMLNVIRGIPGQVRNAVGNLGSVLYQAGRSVIQGLINGINSAIGSLKSKLSSVTALIPSWKGPQERDKVLLRDNGHLIMQSLVDAFEDYIPKIEATLGGITTSMPSMLGETPTINLPRQAPALTPVASAPIVGTQNIYPAKGMSEEQLATYAARKIMFRAVTGAR